MRQQDAVEKVPFNDDELRRDPYSEVFSNTGFKVHLIFTRYNRAESTGELKVSNGNGNSAPFTISGDRLSAKAVVPAIWNTTATCYFDLRPSNDMTLHGTMACEPFHGKYLPKLEISALLF